MKRKIINQFLQTALLCCCLVGISAAQKPEEKQEKQEKTDSCHSEHSQEESKTDRKENISKLVIPDVEVLNQDGKQVKFFTDLVKGKKVFINFIYTSCQMTCPLAGRNFGKLQEYLKKESEKDVFLISVSTDPKIDTPQVLKKWSEKFGRRDGWTLVTGEESKMQELLMALTGTTPQRGIHSSLLVLFDDVSGAWDTTSSLVEPKLLLSGLNKLVKTPAN
jgi:protein SCO1/2